ncbi:hypothetical protein JOY44_04505 [Phormidium sp. CLA17]|uniref:hypothetical protein n=1 Tax=Leptolyngbya sp. Cla-17 TaxID=2803751 RepID=UPI001492C111|nr:hypothetical protein [Leptolyngbya sp. Cla-17]MBM0740883.1 hypothetical protein [Leptolyngbya sp. Cla-17]
MPLYTTPQYPEFIFNVRGSNRDKATFQALQQLVSLINQGTLDSGRFKEFNSKSFIELTEKDLMANNEDKLIDAVKVLSKLATSRQTVQDLHENFLEAYRHIDILFGKDRTSKEDFQKIQDSLKVIKEFGLANLRYKEALIDAETARLIVEQALEVVNEIKNR